MTLSEVYSSWTVNEVLLGEKFNSRPPNFHMTASAFGTDIATHFTYEQHKKMFFELLSFLKRKLSKFSWLNISDLQNYINQVLLSPGKNVGLKSIEKYSKILHFEYEVVAKQTSRHHLVNAFQCDLMLGKHIFSVSHSIAYSIALKRICTLALKQILHRIFNKKDNRYASDL